MTYDTFMYNSDDCVTNFAVIIDKLNKEKLEKTIKEEIFKILNKKKIRIDLHFFTNEKIEKNKKRPFNKRNSKERQENYLA
mgnify:CR=1 FL=1